MEPASAHQVTVFVRKVVKRSPRSQLEFFWKYCKTQPRLTTNDIKLVLSHVTARAQVDTSDIDSLLVLCESMTADSTLLTMLPAVDELLELEHDELKPQIQIAVRTFSGWPPCRRG